MTLNLREPIIVKGYCGYLESYDIEMDNIETIFNITLRNRFDPRITIVMEDIHADEIFKNTIS